MVDYWLKNILHMLLPQPCLLCGEASDGGHDLALCDACMANLPVLGETCQCCANPLESRFERLQALLNEPGLLQTRLCGRCLHTRPYFDHSVAFFPYLSPFDHLIQAAKFRGKLATVRLLGELMAQQLANTPDVIDARPDGLLPVPLHSARQRERGYNQALELARPIAKRLETPILSDLACRTRATPPQSSLSLRLRNRNLKHAFKLNYSVTGQHIAIIDDVMTSGATVNALAKKLKQAGARRVSVWCCCRAKPPS